MLNDIDISFQDILNNKKFITHQLSKFISLKKLTIYLSNEPSFGQIKDKIQIDFAKETKQIIIKLSLSNLSELIVITIDLPDIDFTEFSEEHFSAFFELILENIALKKSSSFDPDLPCLHHKAFLSELSLKIEQVISHLTIDSKALIISDIDFPQGSFHVVGVKLLNSEKLLNEIGFKKWKSNLKNLIKIVKHSLNIEEIYVDTHSHILFLIINNSVNIINTIHTKLSSILSNTKNYEHFSEIKPLTLFIKYPNDIPGYLFKMNPIDLAYEILNILKKGIKILQNSKIPNYPISFKYILNNCAVINKLINMDRVNINIGEDFGIKCGQFFQIFDCETSQLKAELIISNSSRNCSVGDIIIRHNPFNPIKIGDTLKPIQEYPQEKTPASIYKNFILNFYNKSEKVNQFSILHIISPQNIFKDITYILKKEKIDINTEYLGVEKFIILINNFQITKEDFIFQELKSIACSHKDVKIGITNYPLLDLNRLETIKFSIDSLEHALLIPPPKIVIFNSTTFNLRADKLFIKGDIYSAIEEYKRALIMDSQNHIALNSLGVCYGKIGDYVNALKMFKQASTIEKLATYFYNLGSIYMKLNDLNRAEKSFLKCIEIEEKHVFAIIRLAQICELKDQLDLALQWLKKIDPKEYPQIYTLLANLYLKRSEQEMAKKYLESAIRQNPGDASAIFLLGKLYIEEFNDKNTGLSLIKRSIYLKPDKISYKSYLNAIL
ncbi:hypothetical protein JCM12298_06400 [Desulfothermus naphthae]